MSCRYKHGHAKKHVTSTGMDMGMSMNRHMIHGIQVTHVRACACAYEYMRYTFHRAHGMHVHL